MARSQITVNVITPAGIAEVAPTNGDNVNNHWIANNGRTWLELSNADGSNPHTLSIHLPDVDGQAVTAKAYPLVASTTRKRVKLGDPAVYGRKVNIDVDSSQIKITAYTLSL
jgi:hypothetical protein